MKPNAHQYTNFILTVIAVLLLALLATRPGTGLLTPAGAANGDRQIPEQISKDPLSAQALESLAQAQRETAQATSEIADAVRDLARSMPK